MLNAPNTPTPKAPILVSYRNDGAGKGAFFDHYTLQMHTGHSTLIAHEETVSIGPFNSYIFNQVHALKESPVDEKSKKCTPLDYLNNTDGGLLYLPGITREDHDKPSADHRKRMVYERTLIKDALNRGRPILGVCGGSWTLWQSVDPLAKFVDVTDHASSRMPTILSGGDVGYNIHMHNVLIVPNSMLASAAVGKTYTKDTPVLLKANSVHWKACSEINVPIQFKVVARAIQDNTVVCKNRQGNATKPTENSIEAFESVNGTPILGIQWHPEAFGFKGGADNIAHQKVLRFMAQAGDAFSVKQVMLKEYKDLYKNLDEDVDSLVCEIKHLKI